MPETYHLETLKARLEYAIGLEPPYTWAKRIGLGKSTLAGILTKNACPTTTTLRKIADRTNISINWLLTGKGAPSIEPSSNQFAESPLIMTKEPGEHYRVAPKTYVIVPGFLIRMGEGEDRPFQSTQIVDHMAFKSDWVRGVMGLDPTKIVLVSIIGDSMEPTLKEGDLVLLDQRDQNMRNDAIYVMRRDEDLVAKRLQRGFDGSVTIKSDNAAYEDIRITSEQAAQLAILGRVVWTGRRI
ncbi:MAG: helix-turn-helix transcriptional regulator [Magnetococcales bacterium]|nr:helix-turn-helix transcriptional regulator [Magnetococcales bacterium]